jgi:hypothetical protein
MTCFPEGLRRRRPCEAPTSELSSGPASTDASEAGYICRSPILNPEAKTPLATQGESIYSVQTVKVSLSGLGILSGLK